jgi:hypothetical protein
MPRIWTSSIVRWLADLVTDRRDGPGLLPEPPSSGRGGPLGTPSRDLDEAPPSLDQEANRVVSGGGVVDGRGGPSHKADPSR